MQKMIDLGFRFLRYDKEENGFGYFEISYYFGWSLLKVRYKKLKLRV